MKKTLILLAAVVAVCSCSAGKYRKPNDSIRLLQFNVGSFGKYDESGIKTIADIVRALDADIVSLNEVDSCNRRHNTDQTADLASELGGWDFTYGRAMPYRGGAYGNGVVSKAQLLSKKLISLEKHAGSEPRSAAVAETEKFVFISVHLDYKDHASAALQAHQLSDSVKVWFGGSGKPVFLAGDMNATPGNDVIAALEEDWMQISCSEPTFPCPDAKKVIDYIFVLKGGPECKVLRSAVPYEVKGCNVDPASDHYPIFVDVKF